SLDGVTGLTVPPGDDDALAAALQRLADDPALRARFGKAAAARVRTEYRFETIMDKILEVLKGGAV
ncbi:MAG: glycosyltransferase, partial [Oscillospiraceae bacterium]|nr:glycosyltransferase [Oscillospiraceae bacterium]